MRYTFDDIGLPFLGSPELIPAGISGSCLIDEDGFPYDLEIDTVARVANGWKASTAKLLKEDSLHARICAALVSQHAVHIQEFLDEQARNGEIAHKARRAYGTVEPVL